MAITPQDYERGKQDPDLDGLPRYKDIEKESTNAPTRICKACGFTNGCAANHCENTGCVQSTGWAKNLGYTPGKSTATLTR